VGNDDGRVSPCPGQTPPDKPAWIPLDETSQLGVNQTFAGILDATDPTGKNSAPQLIRYMVKANRSLYSYVVQNKFWYTGKGSPLDTALKNFTMQRDQTKNPIAPFVEFRPPPPSDEASANTIEVKGAWRPLTAAEKTQSIFTLRSSVIMSRAKAKRSVIARTSGA
jgi:hypothetical protein